MPDQSWKVERKQGQGAWRGWDQAVARQEQGRGPRIIYRRIITQTSPTGSRKGFIVRGCQGLAFPIDSSWSPDFSWAVI